MVVVTAPQTVTASRIPSGVDFLPTGSNAFGRVLGGTPLSPDRIREALVRNQIEGLKDWFDGQKMPAESVACEAKRILDSLVTEYTSLSREGSLYLLPVPVGSTREDGHAMLSWDQGAHHFEAELLPEGRVEWFYRNRDGLESPWEAESEFGAALPDGALARLDRLRSK